MDVVIGEVSGGDTAAVAGSEWFETDGRREERERERERERAEGGWGNV